MLQVTGIMLPLLKFYFQEEVRQAAVQCMPDLLRSAYLAAQKGMQGADANYVRRMVDFIWGPLIEAIGKVRPLQQPCVPPKDAWRTRPDQLSPSPSNLDQASTKFSKPHQT